MLISLMMLLASGLPIEANGWGYARWGMAVEALQDAADPDVILVRGKRGERILSLERLALASEEMEFAGIDGFRFQVAFYFEGANGRGRGGQLRLIRFSPTEPARCRTLQARLVEQWGDPDDPIPSGGRIFRVLRWTDSEIGQSITYSGSHETAGGGCQLTLRAPVRS